MIDYSEALRRTAENIELALRGAPRDIRDMTGHLAGASGKAARPRLLLACAMDDNALIREDAVKLACAVELFHMATLAHDDVIDDSPLRRGIPTVQSKFGKKQAVICGDYLLCMAAGMAADVEQSHGEAEARLLHTFLDAAKKICVGEKMQGDNVGNLDLDFRRYLKIINGKTAMLFYISSYAGAVMAYRGRLDEGRRQIRALAGFGRCIGVMFQILDDCKDYGLTEADTLKPVRRDIADGVITLPLIMAMAANPELRQAAADCVGGGSVAGLVAGVAESGGVRSALEIAGRYQKKAEKFLVAGTSDGEKRRQLREFAEAINPWKS